MVRSTLLGWGAVLGRSALCQPWARRRPRLPGAVGRPVCWARLPGWMLLSLALQGGPWLLPKVRRPFKEGSRGEGRVLILVELPTGCPQVPPKSRAGPLQSAHPGLSRHSLRPQVPGSLWPACPPGVAAGQGLMPLGHRSSWGCWSLPRARPLGKGWRVPISLEKVFSGRVGC